MILGVDASNIVAGGGVTHLSEVLRVADPPGYGFSKVIIWGRSGTLNRIEDRPWLVKVRDADLDGNVFARLAWQRGRLSSLARQAGCDVLFVPGGSYVGTFHPIGVMSQNLLPFEWSELRRYGWTGTGVRLRLLRWVQSATFRRADGLIFLTRYARDVVMRKIRTAVGAVTVISHGIDDRFVCPPRRQWPIEHYSVERPFHILYVSIIDLYKHQWQVAEAVAGLRQRGVPVVLDLVGPQNPPALERLRATLSRVDPTGEVVRYWGEVPYAELHGRYAGADLCVFASSCENMPNILLEGMASGLPIACSDRGPMPEVLGDAGRYFDPEDAASIDHALMSLIESPDLRATLAAASFERARAFSWRRCAAETFAFLAGLGGSIGPARLGDA